VRRSVYCTASFSVCSRQRTELPIIYHTTQTFASTTNLQHCPSEALEAIDQAEALVERFEQRYWCAELHRLRGVILTSLGAEEIEITASFCAAISTARKQKSISLEKRAEESYAEYHRQKANASGGREFRLPLW
jgi:hypothetical protein